MQLLQRCVLGISILFVGAVHSTVTNASADAGKTTCQLAHEYGYPCEIHHVTTADGYILEMHRIRHGRGHWRQPQRRGICFLQHGVFDTSATWLATGPGNAFAYLLADRGFDVWLGNSRGNFYSRRHVRLRPEQSERDRRAYWDYSFHEIGVYDLPAMLRYAQRVAARGEQRQLHYVGHSQGCAAFFAMVSERPEMNALLASVNALAPTVFLGSVSTGVTRALAAFGSAFFSINEDLACSELKSPVPEVYNAGILPPELTRDVLFTFFGWDAKEFNMTMLPLACGTNPPGGSLKQIVHFGQLIESGRFCPYDYGCAANMQRYGAAIPPAYRLNQCTASVALYYGENDRLATPKDVRHLAQQLPQLDSLNMVPWAQFSHMDFMFAIHAPTLVYDRVFAVIEAHL